MPLLDHFHPPLSPRLAWESFHTVWTAEVMANLNQAVLPQDYYAAASIHFSSRIEVDVATLGREPLASGRSEGGTATMVLAAWAPPAPALVIPTSFPDVIEARVFTRDGDELV